jgi:hypothetical protein
VEQQQQALLAMGQCRPTTVGLLEQMELLELLEVRETH